MAKHKSKQPPKMWTAAGLCAALLLASVYPAQAAGEAEHGHAETGQGEQAEKEQEKIALTPEQIAVAGIKSEVAAPAALATSAQFPGEIKFNADRTAHVVPRMAGVVQSVSADLGQQVKKGELLAVLSSSALSELRSEWLAAAKRRDLAAQTHRRELRLWQEKVSAEQDYQAARTALQEAEIAVQNAEQKLRTVGAEPRSKDLGSLEIRAPFDGVVVEKHIALGEALPDNASIFTLSDLRTVWAEFVIAPKDLQDVRVGEAASVSSAAFAGTATARVTLENPDMAWRPGLFVSVDVVTRMSDAAVTVAADAVQTIDNQPAVFVEAPGGFVVQPVKLGKASNDRVEVLSGLAPGTRYAVENTFVLKSELGKAGAEHAH
jgi:cobalt-zinc-cadmium efflux system membrane fusion protein